MTRPTWTLFRFISTWTNCAWLTFGATQAPDSLLPLPFPGLFSLPKSFFQINRENGSEKIKSNKHHRLQLTTSHEKSKISAVGLSIRIYVVSIGYQHLFGYSLQIYVTAVDISIYGLVMHFPPGRVFRWRLGLNQLHTFWNAPTSMMPGMPPRKTTDNSRNSSPIFGTSSPPPPENNNGKKNHSL